MRTNRALVGPASGRVSWEGRLGLLAIHEDIAFTKKTAKAVNAEFDTVPAWLGLDRVYGRR